MNGEKLVRKLKKTLCIDESAADSTLAARLGYTSANIANLRKKPTELRVSNLVKRAIKSSRASSITTIVEFFDIDAHESRSGASMKIFSSSLAKEHPYLKGLKHELEGNVGIYIFSTIVEGVLYMLVKQQSSLYGKK
jgi:Zn-finger domain-containing protein